MKMQTLRIDLEFLLAHFKNLRESITNFETSGLPLQRSIDVLKSTKQCLLLVPSVIGREAVEKFDSVIEKNPNLEELKQYASSLNGEQPEFGKREPEPAVIAAFKYAPIVTCDVERVFSLYNSMLADNRQKFTFENFKSNFMFHSNSLRNLLVLEI
jgi:hypothetical protein